MSLHLQRQLEDADSTIRALLRRGHVVLSVTATCYGTKPQINVAHTPACAELRGVPTVEVSEGGRVEQYTVATVGNCRVQWRPN